MLARSRIGNLMLLWVVIFVLAAGVFLIWPGIDLAVTRLFYADGQFPAAGNPALQLLRSAFFAMTWAVFLAGLAVAVLGVLKQKSSWLRGGAFVALGMLLGPAVLANGIFKAHWGRARPEAVTEFGGNAQFTPPLLLSDQCPANCSFISGEGSGVFAVFFLLTALVWTRTGPLGRSLWLVFAGGAALFGAGMRVAFGGHFLSDTIFAALFMALIALVLYRLLRPGPAA